MLTPALLIQTSIRPNVSRAKSQRVCNASLSVMSQARPATRSASYASPKRSTTPSTVR